MSHYKIRLDTTEESLVKKLIDLYAVEYVYSFEKVENDSNPHFHLYIKTHSIQKNEKIRTWIRRHIGKGNRNYALVELGKIDQLYLYIAYVIKDGNYHSRISSELLEKAKEHDKKVKSDLKKKRTTVLEQIKSDLGPSYDGTLDELTKYVIQYYVDSGKLLREFQIVSTIQTLGYFYNIDNFRQSFIFSIKNKIGIHNYGTREYLTDQYRPIDSDSE